MTALLSVLVPGTVLLALIVNITIVLGWLRNVSIRRPPVRWRTRPSVRHHPA